MSKESRLPSAVTIAALSLGAVLCMTVFREPVARAAAQLVDAHVTNLDANGHIAVHEQGTAKVRVTNASLPVSLAAGTSVGVSNDASSPVLVRDVDNPGRRPVTFFQQVDLVDGSPAGMSADAFVAPPGTRFVLEFVSGTAALPTGQKAVVYLAPGAASRYRHYLTLVPQGNFPDYAAQPEWFTISQPLRLYSEGFPDDGRVFMLARRSNDTGTAHFRLAFSGFLIDQ